ncbi:MAG: ATP-grasp domain-containing protein [Clostridium sp.]
MKNKNFIKNKTVEAWKGLSVYSAFYKYHKNLYKKTDLEKAKLTSNEKKEYRDYWKSISPIISLDAIELSKSLTGIFNKKIIPEEFFPLYIEPHLNSERKLTFLENKSVYNKWFDPGIFPKDLFHKLNNSYYTHDFKIIKDIDLFIEEQVTVNDFPMVIKPNKNSYGGKDIYFVNSKEDIKKIIKDHPNLVVQEKIEQSKLLDVFNKGSVNTVRICLYKDKEGGVHLLNASIRMGINGSLDNTSAGGIVCYIKPSGMLNKYAFDKNLKKYLKHPNSDLVFEYKKFPLYEELIKASQNVFKGITEAQLVSLDMSLDSNDRWRCIELNFFGQTIRFVQYAGQPFLGEYTDEIIENVRKAQHHLSEPIT